MDIKIFKPHLLNIINKINKQFNINIPNRHYYEDMFNCWMIRKNDKTKFEVRSMYRLNDILTINCFVQAWMQCKCSDEES